MIDLFVGQSLNVIKKSVKSCDLSQFIVLAYQRLIEAIFKDNIRFNFLFDLFRLGKQITYSLIVKWTKLIMMFLLTTPVTFADSDLVTFKRA